MSCRACRRSPIIPRSADPLTRAASRSSRPRTANCRRRRRAITARWSSKSQNLPATEYAPTPPVIVGGDVDINNNDRRRRHRRRIITREERMKGSPMFRVTLGLATATFFGLAAASPASAGCCGSNWGWRWRWWLGRQQLGRRRLLQLRLRLSAAPSSCRHRFSSSWWLLRRRSSCRLRRSRSSCSSRSRK